MIVTSLGGNERPWFRHGLQKKALALRGLRACYLHMPHDVKLIALKLPHLAAEDIVEGLCKLCSIRFHRIKIFPPNQSRALQNNIPASMRSHINRKYISTQFTQIFPTSNLGQRIDRH
ncbi:hypothetical protein KP509_23G059400 [Ceratopteris richardii]|uniref:Uncharacterized protein n=1 Tax=Ceratopteris richardii TaxID=49495 RepID=A0A8T2S258_CERRI|nr:hypothetical protein KP509_23G059400 [Ceratopteris richardii]